MMKISSLLCYEKKKFVAVLAIFAIGSSILIHVKTCKCHCLSATCIFSSGFFS